METEKLILSGSPIEIAEFEDHKMATFLISVLDEYDLKGRMIPRESGELYHSSIVGFPILAKMVCDAAGEPADFAGHEMYIITDENGNSQVRFDTHPIGSVVESWIEEREVAGYAGTKACIMIRAKLWSTRYPEYFAVLDKLWAANNVKSSWELTVQEAVQTVKGRILKAFSFIGNTLLGSSVLGAVPGAGVYEYAQADPELELATALSKDVCRVKKAQREEDTSLDNEKNITSAETEVQETPAAEVDTAGAENAEGAIEAGEQTSAETPVEGVGTETAEEEGESTEPEQAQLTSYDLRRRISEAYRAQYNNWGWVAYWFPADNEAWIEPESRESELEYVKVTYTVDNDAVTITDAVNVTLTVAVSEINSVLAARDEALVKANERVNDLTAQVAALQPYKEAADAAEQARIEAETAEKREQFKAKMLATKLFTEDELQTAENLKVMIECMDEAALKSEVAERFMAKMDAEPAEVATAQVASQKEEARVSVGDAAETDNRTFMRMFLGKN